MNGFRCLDPNGDIRVVTWRLFYPNCPKVNRVCNPVAGAFVAAITVCRQRLF